MFSPLLTQQTPALFPQPTIGRLLNGSLYGHLHIKQQPCYTVTRTQIYRPRQRACCLSVYSRAVFASLSTVIKHDKARGFSTTTSGVAPARPKMLSIALVILLTLGAHAQRGLRSVIPSVRPSVRYPLFCHYAQQGGQKAIPTGSVPHCLDF